MTRGQRPPSCVRWRRIALFFAGAFAPTYGGVAAYLGPLNGSFRDAAWLQLAFVAMLFPALSAIVLQRFFFREPLRQTLALEPRPNRWWLLAWAAGPLIGIGTLAVSLLLPGLSYDPSMHGLVDRPMTTPEQHALLMDASRSLGVHPLVLLLLPSVLLAPTAGMVNGCGEEIGWRGFLFRETASLGFVRQSVVVGLIWALWHWPLVFFGYQGYGDPLGGTAALFASILLVAPLFNYIRQRSGSSLAAGLFHSSLGSGGLLAVAAVRGGSGLTVGFGSFSSCAVLLVLDAAVVCYDLFIATESIIRPSSPGTQPDRVQCRRTPGISALQR